MESEAVVGRRLRVVRELYSAPNECRVFRVSDVHAPHQPEYALKQVSFDSPEGPRAVMHEAGVFSSLRHDCILRHVASWTSDADVAQLDDDARVLGARRSRMLGERDDSTFNHHGDVIEVPTSARTCAVDDVAMLADAVIPATWKSAARAARAPSPLGVAGACLVVGGFVAVSARRRAEDEPTAADEVAPSAENADGDGTPRGERDEPSCPRLLAGLRVPFLPSGSRRRPRDDGAGGWQNFN